MFILNDFTPMNAWASQMTTEASFNTEVTEDTQRNPGTANTAKNAREGYCDARRARPAPLNKRNRADTISLTDSTTGGRSL